MQNDIETSLSATELRDLQCIAGMIIPASTEFGVPGADDPIIFADIVKSLGRDQRDVQAAISSLSALAGGAFADQDASRRYAAAESFRTRGGQEVAALSRAILQCYYRDDRVVLSLGLEARPPFPKGHTLEQGDWSLLDPVRSRPKLWRDAP
jgi:hypothetical protein